MQLGPIMARACSILKHGDKLIGDKEGAKSWNLRWNGIEYSSQPAIGM